MAPPYAHNPPQNRMRQPSGTPRHQNSTGQFHPAPPSHHVARNNHSHVQRPGPPPQHPPVSYLPAGNHNQGNKNNHSATVTQFSPPTPRNRGGCCRWPENRHCCSCFLPLMAFLIWIIAIALGSYATAGCTSTMTGVPSLYVAELGTNTSEYQTNLGIGYFGACLTFTSSPSAPSNHMQHNDSKSTPPGQPDTFCIKNMHNEEQDDLVESFYEGLAGISKGDPEQVEISRVLNLTLPIARHIQEDIFQRAVPVASLVLLTLGAIFLFAGLMVSASRKAHMTALMVGCVMGAISVALLLVMDVGVNGQGMNALMGGDDVDGVEKAAGVYLYRAGQLRWVIIAATVFAGVFYLLMGWMYIRRSAYGKNPIGDWVGKWVNGPGR
ncbi:hypothetical protein QBC43DRAFT_326910 [Cladorrhinum sp. PSN259]|nr:hypothetical protein QBC43DRAFT_326910 [Cladorrhinum sp. PSN259]